MGFFIAKLSYKLFSPKHASILVLGLDGAGKTTILDRLKGGELNKTIPTVGFNVETLKHKGVSLSFLDIGGQDKIRTLWKHYYRNIDGIMFIIDSNDPDTIEDVGEELKKLLAEKDLANCPILIIANKQDLKGALSPEIIEDKLGMKKIEGKIYHVEGTSAVTRKGLKESLNWLVSVVPKK